MTTIRNDRGRAKQVSRHVGPRLEPSGMARATSMNQRSDLERGGVIHLDSRDDTSDELQEL